MSKGETGLKSSWINSKWIKPIAVFIGLVIFLMLFHTRQVDVTGNDHYTDARVKAYVMDRKLSSNSLMALLMNHNRKIEDTGFIDHINVTLEKPWQILITVTEKEMTGYMLLNDTYWYFNREGTVVASSDTPEEYAEDKIYYPFIEGLPAESESLGEKVADIPDDILGIIYELKLYLTGKEQVPDSVEYDEKKGIILHYGDVKVMIGNKPGIEDKISHLYGILPNTEGLSGTLHLDNFDSSKGEVVFTKDS